MVDTMRDHSAILFPPARSAEPQSSDRSDCTGESSRNSRIVPRSIFDPRFQRDNREDGHTDRTQFVRAQFAVGLRRGRFDREYLSKALGMNSSDRYPEIRSVALFNFISRGLP